MADTPVLSPDHIGEVQELKPQSSGALVITPETIVLCVNRGREPLEDTFDSRHYIIQPGYFSVQLGAARHFKDRAVVPGSRNPETRFQASFISIIGVVQPVKDGFKVTHPIDDVVQWDPFTDDECREYGHAVEALDRASMVDPIDGDVTLQHTRGQRNEDAKKAGVSRLKGGSGTKKGSTRITGTAVEKGVLKPGNTEPNEATRTIAADLAAVAQGKDA